MKLTYDQGTGVLDKNSIRTFSEDTLKHVKDVKNLCWLAIVDIDDFKHINDTYGHAFGDVVLKKVSEILKRYLKDKGEIGRFGGDEFFICINDETEETVRDIFRLSRRDIQLATIELMSEGEPGVTLSIGTVSSPLNGTDYAELFDKADKALYIAKGKGKNRYIIYRKEMHGDIVIPNGVSGIKYAKDYTLRMTESVNHCMDILFKNREDGYHDARSIIMDAAQLSFATVYNENGKTIFGDMAPEFDWSIKKEIMSSTDSFATGLLTINNIKWIMEQYPHVYEWMIKNGLREAVFYYPYSKPFPDKTPMFVFGSSILKKWGAEDPHYFMMYSNLLLCALRNKAA